MSEEQIAQPKEETFNKVDSSQTLDLIDKANEAADRLEKAQKDYAALLNKHERLAVISKLSGVAEAGKKEISKEEKEFLDAKKLLEGSGFEDMFN